MPIKNRDRFPNVDFLPSEQIRLVGSVDEEPLMLVGFERGTDDPLVARSYTNDPASEQLFAVPLSELLTHVKEPISIPSPITRG